MKPYDIANGLEHMLNCMCGEEEEEEFINAVMHFHRTLQQKCAGLFIRIFVRWAQCLENDRFDLRNEATVKIAMSIVEHLAVNDMLYKGRAVLPFI